MAEMNYGSVAQSGMSGAAAGTAVMPGWGTVIGGAIGLGIGFMGASASAEAASKAEESQKKQVQLELQAEGVRRQYMEMKGRRDKMENFRKMQQMHALALNNAASQGAQFGSGLAGGQAQISAQGGWNELGINQSLMSGRQLFDINAQLSQEKLKTMQAQQGMQVAQATTSASNSALGSLGQMNQLTGGAAGQSQWGTNVWNANTGSFMGSGSFNKGNM